MSQCSITRLCVACLVVALFAVSPSAAVAAPRQITTTPYPTATVYPTPTILPTATAYPTPAPRAYLPVLYANGAGPTFPSVSFWADRYAIENGECINLHWRVDAVAQVTLENSPVGWKGYQTVCPLETRAYRLNVEFQSGALATWTLTITVNDPPTTENEMLFWAERYALPPGGCTTLHWRIEEAIAVFLDGAGVPGTGTQQACPINMQFYTLEAVRADGTFFIREVVLSAGDPALSAGEVIAQAVVGDIEWVSDSDPFTPGAQPGYLAGLEQVEALYAYANWAYPRVSLGIPRTAIDLGPTGPLHWPLHVGQGVEFRAACQGDTCLLDYTTDGHLYRTTE